MSQLSIFDSYINDLSKIPNYKVLANFGIKPHARENNAESQSIYDNNKAHFARQDRKVLRLLKAGMRLTSMNCIEVGIVDLRRRIKTLRDNGIACKFNLLGGRLKEWYL